LHLYYIKKNGLFLKVETVTFESDYWEVSELIAEHKTRYSWTKNKDEAVFFIDKELADTYLAKRYKQSFFRDAQVN